MIQLVGAQEHTGDEEGNQIWLRSWSLESKRSFRGLTECRMARKIVVEFCPVHILSFIPSLSFFLMAVGLKMNFKFKRIHLKRGSLACIYKNNFSQLEHEHMFHICGDSTVQHAVSQYHTKVKY